MALTKIKLDSMVTGNLPDANIPNNITIDTASAAPASGLTGNTLASGITSSSLTSVGTLTSLTTSGQLRVGGTGSGSSENLLVTSATSSDHTRVHIEKTANAGSAGVSLKSYTPSSSWTIYQGDNSDGDLIFHDGGDSVLTLATDNSATFAGDVTISKSSAKMTIFATNTGDHESLVFDRNTASNGDSQEIRWKLQGSNYPGGYISHEYEDANNSTLAFGVRVGGTPATTMLLKSNKDVRFSGVIMADQSGTSDYSNTALKTIDGNDHNGVRIKHGGGNGQIAIYGGNQDRTRIKPNQIEANVNGLEIKTTDAQSLTLGTNNTTRMLIDSSGRAEFKKLIHRVNTEQQQQTNLMSCFHWDHPGTDSTSFFDFNPVLDLGLRQEGGSFFLKISGWPLDRFFGLITYRNNGGSGDINSGSHSMDTIINDGFSVSVSRPSGNLIRIQLSGHHNNNHAWDMMAFSAPFVT
tara:strand:- start:15428 stop:16825 length:1398 start_codon:yes stop_codon:yes gene_type:complete